MTDNTIVNNLLCKHYAGELAYIDSFSGLIKCKVLKIVYRESKINWKIEKACKVKVTQKNLYDESPYPTGNCYTINADNIIPRKHVYVSSGHYRIRNNYTWMMDGES